MWNTCALGESEMPKMIREAGVLCPRWKGWRCLADLARRTHTAQ